MLLITFILFTNAINEIITINFKNDSTVLFKLKEIQGKKMKVQSNSMPLRQKGEKIILRKTEFKKKKKLTT